MDTPTSILNSLLEPEFPLSQEQAASLTPENFVQVISTTTETIQTWFRYMKDMEAYKSDLQQYYLQLEKRLQTKDTDLTLAYMKADTLEKLLQNGSHQPTYNYRSTRLPDPEKFDGNRTDLDQFLTQLRLKLQTNADHFPTKDSRLGYAISRLDGDALKQVTPRLQQDTIDFSDLPEFYNYLKAAFGDPDSVGTARRRLMSLKQKNQEFSTFIAEFNRIAPDTGLDEASKKFALQQGLSAELQALMIHHEIPDAIQDYISLLQRLDSRMRMATTLEIKKPSYSRATTLYPTSPSTISYPKTVISRPVSPSLIPSDSISQYTPMDLSGARRGPVQPEEKERRRKLGLCGYCGGQGHNQFSCKLFKCYNCGETGHGAQGCKKPRRQRVQELTTVTNDIASGNGVSLD